MKRRTHNSYGNIEKLKYNSAKIIYNVDEEPWGLFAIVVQLFIRLLRKPDADTQKEE